jgi:hypothetical protein
MARPLNKPSICRASNITLSYGLDPYLTFSSNLNASLHGDSFRGAAKLFGHFAIHTGPPHWIAKGDRLH